MNDDKFYDNSGDWTADIKWYYLETPPTVSSTNPANNATDVDDNTTITASFSEAMDSSTITTDTFLVSGSGYIIGTVTYSGTTATFTPTANLDYNNTYTATINRWRQGSVRECPSG